MFVWGGRCDDGELVVVAIAASKLCMFTSVLSLELCECLCVCARARSRVLECLCVCVRLSWAGQWQFFILKFLIEILG